jgi:integrase
MPVIKLTQQLIDSGQLQCPPDKRRVEYVDTDRSGLCVEVRNTAPGQGTYYLRTKIDGKSRHFRIGSTDDITLAEARSKVKTLKAGIALGNIPGADKPVETPAMTWDAYMQEHYLPHTRLHLRSHDKIEGIQKNWLSPVIGKKTLGEITRGELQALHNRIRQEGYSASSANHVIRTAKAAYNHAIRTDLFTGKNPAVGIKLFREPKTEHYLKDDELERLIKVLKTDKNRPVCLLALFLLATGMRLNEALSTKWSDVDIGNRLLVISSERSKSKAARSVPLSDTAIGILEVLREMGDGVHVFVGKLGQPLKYVHKVWNRLRNEAGLPHLRMHDLRHQYASFLVNSGRTLYEVQQILGHSSPLVTQRYAHLSTKAMQEAADTAGDIIADAMAKSR